MNVHHFILPIEFPNSYPRIILLFHQFHCLQCTLQIRTFVKHFNLVLPYYENLRFSMLNIGTHRVFSLSLKDNRDGCFELIKYLHYGRFLSFQLYFEIFISRTFERVAKFRPCTFRLICMYLCELVSQTLCHD